MESIDDLINLCIPPDRNDDPLFVEGMDAKRRWATKVMEKYGTIAKLAYLNSEPNRRGMLDTIGHISIYRLTDLFGSQKIYVLGGTCWAQEEG